MYKKLVSQTAIYGVSSVIVKVFPFLLTPILTHIFGPAAYSPFVNFYSAAAVISVFLTHGMETTIFNFANKDFDKNSVLTNAFFSVLGLTIIFLTFSLTFKQELADAFRTPNQVNFLVWFLWILSIDAVSSILFAKLRLEEKPKKYAVIRIINTVFYFSYIVFSLIIVPYLMKHNILVSVLKPFYHPELGIGNAFIANLLASILTLILLLPELFSFKFIFNSFLYKKMWQYSWPIMIAGLAGVINESIDRQFLKYLLPKEEADWYLGVYGAVYKVATFITLLKTAYLLGIEPFIFSHSKHENSDKTYATLMKFFIIILSLSLMFLLGNIEWIKKIFISNPEYWSGFNVVPFILYGTVFLGIYLNLSVWYKITDKTYYGAIFSVLGAIITIIINVIFIPKYNIYACSLATLISYLVMMMLSYYWGQKIYPIPYNTRKFVLYLGLAIVFSSFNFWVLDSNILVGNLLFCLLCWIIFRIERPLLKKILPKTF